MNGFVQHSEILYSVQHQNHMERDCHRATFALVHYCVEDVTSLSASELL